MMRRWALFAVSFLLPATSALAQDDPEAGITSPPPVETETPPSSAAGSGGFSDGWETPPPSDDDGDDDDDDDDGPPADSDHAAVVGHFSLGLLGLAALPVAVGDPINVTGGARTVTKDEVLAPLLGSRYWVSERWGIEAGAGLSIHSGSLQVGSAGSVDSGKITGFGLHVGVPVAATWGKHYTLLFVPYFALGYTSSEDSRGTAATADDVFGTGVAVEGGLKGGVEIQLGAIGLEGFALQLSTGVRLRSETRTANVPTLDMATGVMGDADVVTKDFGVETTPGSSLGAAVGGTLAALYYF